MTADKFLLQLFNFYHPSLFLFAFLLAAQNATLRKLHRISRIAFLSTPSSFTKQILQKAHENKDLSLYFLSEKYKTKHFFIQFFSFHACLHSSK